ncbi:unnamed protein product [Discula destructiva]
MASRSFRGRRIVDDSSSDSDDEFPDLRNISTYNVKPVNSAPAKSLVASVDPPPQQSVVKSTVRRRKLGAIADNPLLRPLGGSSSSTTPKKDETAAKKKTTTPQRIELRTRRTQPTSLDIADLSESGSIHEETILEYFSGSDFAASSSSEQAEDDDSSFQDSFQLSRPSTQSHETKGRNTSRERQCSPSPGAQLLAEAKEAEKRNLTRQTGRSRREETRENGFLEGKTAHRSFAKDLGNPLLDLHIEELKPTRSRSPENGIEIAGTPPSPSKPNGLASPSKKISRIPATPHHPLTDTFWNQEFIDEWNDEHSPKKQLFPPSAVSKSPSKRSSSPKKGQPSQATALRAAKKAFEQEKHDLADDFLRELDERITNKELSELSAATGGIRIEWTNKLHTTAGRANWKRETVKSKNNDGDVVSTRYRHHASVELSTKVIDDENRLLNVIAHEFCHLANFMISGITTNPHGKEFKVWAAKVTSVFGDRGIDVTTKHSYDIDFKYVWECTVCGIEFKRHSKSINPIRHRCGACKSELKQTKPVPRSNKGKESEYQKFMKEQMRLIKEQNPGSPQKDIMKLVASRWAQRDTQSVEGDSTVLSQSSAGAGGKEKRVEGVTKTMSELTFIDLT